MAFEDILATVWVIELETFLELTEIWKEGVLCAPAPVRSQPGWGKGSNLHRSPGLPFPAPTVVSPAFLEVHYSQNCICHQPAWSGAFLCQSDP